MNAYGFHGLHGRALPIAEGIKMRRPDLHVFVVTGDGDCCSIGTAHWIHAIRYNMDMTVLLMDNRVYGLTKNQASPTSPLGQTSNTTPRGTVLGPLNPVSVTLGINNVSFVAQAVDWIPELLHDVVARAYRHKGLSFVRVLQRCPEFLPNLFDPYMRDPDKILVLSHPDGVTASPDLSRIYRQQEAHDPADLPRAKEIAAIGERIPVGVLYRNEEVPRYEELHRPEGVHSARAVEAALDAELDKFTIWPAA
jgi:2-oxoglutarate ferredoxin oxidoreductase subunit beta